MKTIGIHQPNFSPWIGYFVKVLKSDVFVLLDNVQFTKGGFTNRVKIKNKNGEDVWITVPLKVSDGHFKMINEMQVDYSRPWQKDMENKLRDFYRKAPYVKETIDQFFSVIYRQEYPSLASLNTAVLLELFSWLEIKTEIRIASEMDLDGLVNNELLIAIIRQCGGDNYISGLGGKKYMDEEMYKLNGISLSYNEVRTIEYPQVNGDKFIPSLSILDMLFNIGIEGSKKILKELSEE